MLVPQRQLVAAPAGLATPALAALPYSFTTMWLAVRSAGLHAGNAKGKRVLVNGANGGLGRLALQLLSSWGCELTAIGAPGSIDEMLAAGATVALERGPGTIPRLRAQFDVVLNFGGWDDDAALAARLHPEPCGHATTVHPLLGHFDRLGWWRGALAVRRDLRRAKAQVAAAAPKARYSWTVFKPDREALEAPAQGLAMRQLSLPVGVAVPLHPWHDAFAHVAAGKPGRAVLLLGA